MDEDSSITISSMATEQTGYESAKSSFNDLMRVTAADFPPDIRVNTVAPDVVKTERVDPKLEEARSSGRPSTSERRWDGSRHPT